MKMKKWPLVWSEIRLDYLRDNLKIIRLALKKSSAEILAVVKADAYGHGMQEIGKALAREGVRFFGVANIEEALALSKSCPRGKILVLGSFHESQVPWFIKHSIIPSLSSLEDAALFEKALARRSGPFGVHVKVDTGMGRLGIWHEEAESFFKKFRQFKKLSIDGVYTHFSNADESSPKRTEIQIKSFEKLILKIESLGLRPRYYHAANSVGLMRFRHSHLNLVRPGIILYGINPCPDSLRLAGLKPILSLKTRVSFLKEVEKGRAISYGATYHVLKKTRIATLPIGYSHGYRVGFSNKAQVMIRGQKCPVVGRVTMDHTLVDVGRVRSVRRWDEVTLIGEEGNAKISAGDLSNLIGSIPYEIVCSIHSRIPRIYRGG